MAFHKVAASSPVQDLLDSLGGWTEDQDTYRHPGGHLAVRRTGNRWSVLMDDQQIDSGYGPGPLIEALKRY